MAVARRRDAGGWASGVGRWVSVESVESVESGESVVSVVPVVSVVSVVSVGSTFSSVPYHQWKNGPLTSRPKRKNAPTLQ